METRRMCPHCRAFITTSDKVCPYCNEAVTPPRRVERESSGPILGGLIPNVGYLTILILIINSGLYLATALYSTKGGRGNFINLDTGTLILFGAKFFHPELGPPQWWRLLTAGFLHGGILHILMNSWVLFDLGAQIEELYGNARMLVIWFVSTVVGFYASAVWNPATPSVGASAALFGLVGAMLALSVRYKGAMADLIRGVYMRYLVYLLLFSFLPGIDMAAHVGGLAGGFATAYIAGRPEYQRMRPRKPVTLE
jgi:membrane associated rhomboid family serine protease